MKVLKSTALTKADFKPYNPRILIVLGAGVEELEADICNYVYYLRAATKPTNWMTPQPQYLHFLRQRVADVLIEPSKIESISSDDLIKAVRIVLRYCRKEHALAKRERRKYAREQKAMELVRANKLCVRYEGQATYKMLFDVISKLDVWHIISPKALLTLQASTERRDTSYKFNKPGEMRYSAYEIVANGYLTIAGYYYEYSEVLVDHGAYDHFPPG